MSTQERQDRLAELQRLTSLSVGGPWEVHTDHFNAGSAVPPDGVCATVTDAKGETYLADVWDDFEGDDRSVAGYRKGTGLANAKLMAAAPWLVAEVTRLTQENARLKALYLKMCDDVQSEGYRGLANQYRDALPADAAPSPLGTTTP